MSKGASLLRIVITYAAATAVAGAWLALGPDTRWLWLDALIADVLATLVVFAASRLLHNSSCYDAYWSVAPPLIATYWAASGAPVDARGWLLLVVVWVWAIRLTGNWAYGWPGLAHEDWRYGQLREGAGRAELPVDLFAIHLIPTLQVFVALAPAYVVLVRSDRPFGVLDVVATMVGLGAVALEYVADGQLRAFAATKRPGEVMDRGLWGWSRHPNYFGEFSFWLSIGLFGLAAAPGEWWWVFLGALAMLALLLFASIPMMEERSLARRPGYQAVIDRVSKFVPLPPRRTA